MRPYGSQGRRYCPDCRARRYQRNGHTERFKEYRRRWQLQNRYGITEEQFEQMAKKQNGLCAICGNPPTSAQKGETLHVDHDHDSGAVRGLLCNQCNVGLANFCDDPKRLEAAAQYLRAALKAVGA